jgi:hypothetical protein
MENSLMVQQQKGSLQYVDPAAVAAAEAAKARIQSAYQMAIYRPRNSDESRDRILHACRRPMFAEKVEFSKPVGGKQIKGPSIRFAELALREWGNILSDVQILYEDDFVRRSRVMVVDLETNASFSKEIQINKTVERKNKVDREVLGERTNTQGQVVYIVKATEDELQNKENAAISKAVRNEGLRVIPTDIVDEALATAKATLADRDKADPDQAKKKILDSFSELGVKPKDLQKYLGHPTDSLSPKELADLRGIYRAIKDGEASWADYTTEGPKETDPGEAEEAKKKLSAAAAEFDKATTEKIKTLESAKMLAKYLEVAVNHYKKSRPNITTDDIKAEALKDLPGFLAAYEKWALRWAQKEALKKKAAEKASGSETVEARFECPKGGYVTKAICGACKDKTKGCPDWV